VPTISTPIGHVVKQFITHHLKKIHSLSTGGAHSRVLAYIASPTSPPYVGKQLTALFHAQPLSKYLVYSIAPPTVNCVF